MTEITLAGGKPATEGQQKAVQDFIGFMASDDPVFVIQGYSGTGKSTLIEHLIKEMPSIQKTIKLIKPSAPTYELELTATTNKAADNFHQITGQEVNTIQSYLGLTVQTDYQTRETKLVLRKYVEKHYKVLFIDEASYIDPPLLTWIFKLMKNSKIIFIGDPAQLTPVKSRGTPVFDAPFPRAHLTEVVRAKLPNGEVGKLHPITELATKLRNTVNTGEFFKFTPDGFHIRHLPREEFNQEILKEFTRPDWKSNDSKVLAWTNRRVIDYNTAIRNHVKGVSNFQVGDYAVCNKYFTQNKMNIKTDATVLITNISEPTTQYGVPGKFYTLDGRIAAFCPDRLEDKIERIKRAKEFEDYQILEDIDTSWIDIRAMYACTINKSQGSTYDKVFIDLDDIKGCNSGDQIARMLYVGTSRARHHVYFTGDLV